MKMFKWPVYVICTVAGLLVLCVGLIFTLRYIAIQHSSLHVPNAELSQHWVLDNVFVVSIGEVSNKPQQIEIRDGKIISITPSGRLVHDNLRRIDGHGAYVSAGLIDTHTHIEDRQYLALALSKGVTTVRDMRGRQDKLLWRREVEKGLFTGSRLVVASPILDGDSGALFHQFVNTPQKAQQLVSQYAEQGYDLVKIYLNLKPDVFDAAVNTARRFHMDISKHGPLPVKGAEWKSLNALGSLEHVEDILNGPLKRQFDQAALDKVIENLKALRVTIVPTLAVFDELTQISLNKQDFLRQQPLLFMNSVHRFLLHKLAVERWLNVSDEWAAVNQQQMDWLLKITRQLYQNDIPLALGSDSGALVGQTGFASIHEIKLLKQAGIPDSAILAMATVNAADVLGSKQLFGSVETGKAADLLLLKHDPNSNILTIEQPLAVIKGGQYFDKAALEQLRMQAKQTQSAWLTASVMLADILMKMWS